MNLPPSALPGISLTRGEITRGNASPISKASIAALFVKATQGSRLQLISPLMGEMPGRAEGGVTCPRQ
ncbi:hypothetical protein D3C80_155930 [compost metagenome]